MTQAKDIVLGAVNGYTWDKIEAWALSLRTSGYKGLAAVIVYDNEPTVLANLRALKFQVIQMPLMGSVYHERFTDFHHVLNSTADRLRFALVTDVRDVYFQEDPMPWLEANLTAPLYAVGEAMTYFDEPWNRNNLLESFPFLVNRIGPRTVRNAGVMAGRARAVADLCLAVGLTAKSTTVKSADQPAYNVLLDLEPYRSTVQFGCSEDGFVCQAGTLADPTRIEGFRPHLSEPEPVLDGLDVRTAGGRLYPVLHQYERNPAWDVAMRERLNRRLAPTRWRVEAEQRRSAS